MTDEQAVGIISAEQILVHVEAPEAYDAFRSGRVIFDITGDARLLRKFKAENLSEFGPKIQTDQSGNFRYIDHPGTGRRAYVTFHLDLFHKYIAQNELFDLEEEYPQLFQTL